MIKFRKETDAERRERFRTQGFPIAFGKNLAVLTEIKTALKSRSAHLRGAGQSKTCPVLENTASGAVIN